VIVYRAVPYLVVAAPPVIVLITMLISGCTMTRTANDPPMELARFYSDRDDRAGKELTRELDLRAAREELRRIVDEPQR
jgi:hypothetical protein